MPRGNVLHVHVVTLIVHISTVISSSSSAEPTLGRLQTLASGMPQATLSRHFPIVAGVTHVADVSSADSLLPSDACDANVDLGAPHLANYGSLLKRAAAAFAAESGATGKSLRVTITDVVAIRTGQMCMPLLPPLPEGAGGFIQGLHLVAGPPQQINWWHPHLAAFTPGVEDGDADAVTLASAGDLWLHHGSTLYHAVNGTRPPHSPSNAAARGDAASRSSAVWVRFHAWYSHASSARRGPAAISGRSTARRGARCKLRTLWDTPVAVVSPLADLRAAVSVMRSAALRGDLQASAHASTMTVRQRATASEACAQPPSRSELHRSRLSPPLSEMLDALASVAVREAAALLESMPPLALGGARVWELPPGATLAPQAAAAQGLVRAIVVLSPGAGKKARRGADGHAEPPVASARGLEGDTHARSAEGQRGGSGAFGPLRLQLMDPRPAAVRLAPELVGAEFPFGLRNAHLSLRTSRGTLLLFPAGVRYHSAVLETSRRGASWIEMDLVPRYEGVGRQPTETVAAKPQLPSSPDALAEGTSSTDGTHGPLNAPVARSDDGMDASTMICPSPVTESAEFGPTEAQATLTLTHPPVHRLVHSTLVSVHRLRKKAELARVAAAARVIRMHAQSIPSANLSNVGGWQSRADYLMEEREVFEPLYPLLYGAITEHIATTMPARLASHLDLRLSGWANANGRGHSNALHDHADQDWALSGVLHLDDGADARCSLTFASPLPPTAAEEEEEALGRAARASGAHDESEYARRLGDGERQLAPPTAGTIHIFPAWLSHRVPPHCGPRDRLSVAFNAAALLPTRVWPDGDAAKPVPSLGQALDTARAQATRRQRGTRSAASPSTVHHLWPLRIVEARIAPSATTASALPWTSDAIPLDQPSGPGGGCTRAQAITCCVTTSSTDAAHAALLPGCPWCGHSGGILAPLLAPMGETIVHALTADNTGTSRVEMGKYGIGGRGQSGRTTTNHEGPLAIFTVDVCQVGEGFVDSHAATRMLETAANRSAGGAVAMGMLFPPRSSVLVEGAAAAEPDAEPNADHDDGCASTRRLLLPDVRIAAGDLNSYLSMRERYDAGRTSPLDKGMDAADGSIFVFPPWARALAVPMHRSWQCEQQQSRSSRYPHTAQPGFFFRVSRRAAARNMSAPTAPADDAVLRAREEPSYGQA